MGKVKKKKKVVKKYSCTHSEMLQIAEIVCKHTETKSKILIEEVNTNYKVDFAKALIVRIVDARNNILNFDIKKDQREATQILYGNRDDFKKYRRRLKKHIKRNFEDDRSTELAKQLDFSTFDKAKNKNDQEKIKNALYGIKSALENGVKDEVVTSGLPAKVLDNLITLADIFAASNTNQELKKDIADELSEAKQKELNEIYNLVIGICDTSADYFGSENDETNRQNFTWDYHYKRLSGKAKSTTKQDISNPEENTNAEVVVEN